MIERMMDRMMNQKVAAKPTILSFLDMPLTVFPQHHPMLPPHYLRCSSSQFVLLASFESHSSVKLKEKNRFGVVGGHVFVCQSPIVTSSRTQIANAKKNRTNEPSPWLAQLQEEEEQEGPIRLPPLPSSSSSFGDPFDTSNPSPIQVATSVLLTGAISVFLFRSLRRRARRAKELRMRSSEVKNIKEDALESLKAMGTATLKEGSPPSPVQALLGGLAAGAIALILYKFTTTIEAALNRQAISDNFSVRQITITVRTIVNGLCYLATFVFALNSIGLILYSGQLTLNSFMGSDTEGKRSDGKDGQQKKTGISIEPSLDNVDPIGSEIQKIDKDK